MLATAASVCGSKALPSCNNRVLMEYKGICSSSCLALHGSAPHAIPHPQCAPSSVVEKKETRFRKNCKSPTHWQQSQKQLTCRLLLSQKRSDPKLQRPPTNDPRVTKQQAGRCKLGRKHKNIIRGQPARAVTLLNVSKPAQPFHLPTKMYAPTAHQ